MSRNQGLLRYGRCSCDLYSRYYMWFPCISIQLSALRHTEVHILSKIPGFTRISWHAFSSRCCNTTKSLIGAEHTEVLGVPTAKNPEDQAGQLNGPSRSIHCSPKIWFRCCLAIWRKWSEAPSCMNYLCCRSWRGTSSKEYWWIIHDKDGTLHLLVCSVRQLVLRVDHLRCPP
jgi:hypothetical protein